MSRPTQGTHHDFTSVIPSEELVQYIHPSLLHLDYERKEVQISIIAVTCIGYALFSVFIYLIYSTTTMFLRASWRNRIFLTQAIYRGFFGSSCVVLGTYSFVTFTNLDRHLVLGKTATSYFASMYTIGFFVYDLGNVAFCTFFLKPYSKMSLFHHSVSLFVSSINVYYGVNHCLGSRLLTLEMVTPLSSIAFILSQAGKEDSTTWRLVQFLHLHAYHLRNVVECYCWYLLLSNWEMVSNYTPLPPNVSLLAGMFSLLFVMTPSWAYHLTIKLGKSFHKSKQQ